MDADSAGAKNAEAWISRSQRCRRVSPPAKDWTAAHCDGFNLRDWWDEWLAGRDPERFDPSWYPLSDIWDT